MRYINTSRNSVTDLKGAIMHPMAPDGTLYLPESMPVLPQAFFNNISGMSLQEIAYVVVSALLGTDTEHSEIKRMVDRSFSFPIPLVRLPDGTQVVELFHGPTMAFKDVSVRFMAEYVESRHKKSSRTFVGIVATTGNTGVAVSNAFAKYPDQKMVVMFPRGCMNRLRRNIMSRAGGNVFPVEVEGSIGQCKKLIEQAMADQQIAERMMAVCANTKNFLRIVPQVAVFFHTYARLKSQGVNADGMTVAIPSACLSNLLSAVVAKRLGLPIGRIVAATNSNDDFVRVVNGEIGIDRVHSNSRSTLAPAMDSGYPTNLLRLLAMYDNDLDALRRDIVPVAVSDDEIVAAVRSAEERLGYLIDPHTAVAMSALARVADDGSSRVVLATAHPSKSLDVMTEITGRAMELPLQMTRLMGGAEPHRSIPRMAPTYPAFKKFLLSL